MTYALGHRRRKQPERLHPDIVGYPWWQLKPKRRRWGFWHAWFDRIAHPENLVAAYRRLRARGGQAAGPDGVRFDAVSDREACNILRGVADQLKQGTYCPARSRVHRIPKASGGCRELRLQNIFDRTVSEALHLALATPWDGVFADCSFGFRPARSHLTLLARLFAVVKRDGRWVVGTTDITDAFGHVRVAEVTELHRRRVRGQRLLDLIENLLRDGRRGNPCVGIAQGNPYSPNCLNAVLHEALDTCWDSDHELPPLFRFADNIVVAGRSEPECRRALDRVEGLLATSGFSCKTASITDLREGQPLTLLGFEMRSHQDALSLSVSEEAWAQLGNALHEAHNNPVPGQCAQNALLGWMASLAPGLGGTTEVDRALSTCSRWGFREVLPRVTLLAHLRRGWERWEQLLTHQTGGE